MEILSSLEHERNRRNYLNTRYGIEGTYTEK